MAKANLVGALAKAAFDEAKHKRGQGGKFASKGLVKPGGKKPGGSVAQAHALFEKMAGKPKADVLAAASAAGINPNTAKTQLYHWQKAKAKAALGNNPNPTKADLQAAAAKALGVKPSAAPKPAPAPAPPPAPKPAPKPPTPTPVTAPQAKAPALGDLGPTKYVHALADHMKGASKKDVIAEAVKQGVNKSTAGVQYGKWQAKQKGEVPQLKKSPEPKPLQAKQPEKMSDKELDQAIAAYQGKVEYKADSANYAPKPYKHAEDYYPGSGGKALTAKMQKGDVYTHPTQGKTFYKAHTDGVYEHTGKAGPMTKLSGDSPIEYHYDPDSKIVYGKKDGVLVPIKNVSTPVFKNDQPYEAGEHVFKDHPWSTANGVHDPSYELKGDHHPTWKQILGVHTASGVTYSKSGAVEWYTGSGYTSINDGLRGKHTLSEKAKEATREIDEEMSKSSFKEETVMWRGVGQGGTVWNGAPPPATVTDEAFTSVSYNPSVAVGFSDKKTLFRVKVPKGFPGLNVAIGSPGAVTGLMNEAEVMLPRGTTYKVVARHAQLGPKSIHGNKMDVVDLEPVLPEWYIKKYGQPKAA